MNAGYGVSATAAYPYTTSSHPVDVQYPALEGRNRLYAVPIVGLLIKEVLLIPHLIVLYVLNIIVGVLNLVTWIPVLFTGRYPAWGHMIVGGTLSWQTRVMGYLLGLSDRYPAFSLADPAVPDETHMLLQPAATANKLYAVPILGYVIKSVMLIPHFIVLYILGLVAMLVMLVAWIPVLTTGRYPQWALTIVGGLVRWVTRVYAFHYGLTDTYPPFSLAS